MSSKSADLEVEGLDSATLRARLQALLDTPATAEARAHTARGWLDLATEAAYGERLNDAVSAAERGLEAPGGDDPENRLMLLRLMAGVAEIRKDHESSATLLQQRVRLLYELGRTEQAKLESDLGPMLLREPDRVEGEILARMDEELAETAPDSVYRADVLASLAVRRLHDEGPQAAVELVAESCRILSLRRKPQSLAGARMFLAHAQLLSQEPDAALKTADKILSAPANRAVRAAMAMLRATVHHHADRNEQAMSNALLSAELYAACGVRRGSASAAALLAGITSSVGEDEAAVLAWRVSVQQAELGEYAESGTLSLALGQQLLEMDEDAEAEKVLDPLVVRLGKAAKDPSTLGRALMGLGHAVARRKRPVEAMAHWTEAAGQFLQAQEIDEAARAHLAVGAMAASLEHVDAAREHYEQGLQLADQDDTDPLMLLQALHSLGHLLCRHEDQEGLNHLSRALRIAEEHGSDWQRADITDTQARSLTALGRGPQAVAAALEAADLFGIAGDEESAADAEILAATVLLQTGQPEEAESVFRIAAETRDVSDSLLAQVLEGRIESLRASHKPEAAAGLSEELEGLRAKLATAEDPPQQG